MIKDRVLSIWKSWMSLRIRPVKNIGANGFAAKIGSDEAEAERFGGSKVKANNEVWADFAAT